MGRKRPIVANSTRQKHLGYLRSILNDSRSRKVKEALAMAAMEVTLTSVDAGKKLLTVFEYAKETHALDLRDGFARVNLQLDELKVKERARNRDKVSLFTSI